MRYVALILKVLLIRLFVFLFFFCLSSVARMGWDVRVYKSMIVPVYQIALIVGNPVHPATPFSTLSLIQIILIGMITSRD